MRRICVIAILMCVCVAAFSQVTKVRGRVMDAFDGQGVPFAAVFFEGTETGVSCDADGWFSLSTRDLSLTLLRAQQLGYYSSSIPVKPGIFNDINIMLRQEKQELSTVVVKADNRKVKRLLSNIDAHRDRNNPELRPAYHCDVYSKIELDLTHPREQLRGPNVRKHWGFIFDYVDTSDVSGVPYLPVMISESKSQRFHSTDPASDREVITASNISGTDPSGSLLSQFTGSMHLKNNFYSQFINAFDVEIPSPINNAGLLFYNYFIIDSLKVDGRKTYRVRYHPKPAISTPAFDGEMLVDAEEFALRSIRAKMVKGQNINWLRDMVLEASYQRQSDSTWFYKSDRFYADFSVVMSDSSKMMSFIANRQLEFSNPVFEKGETDYDSTVSVVDSEAGFKDAEFWDQARPYPLSEKERGIYDMVDKIQDTRLYRTWYDVVAMIVNGYYDVGNLGYGPILQLVSYNPLEGFRMRLGVRTSPEWSRKDRLMAYAAFGCKDLMPKGGATWEHLFSKEPTRKLTADVHFDVLQLGSGNNKFNEGNLLSSVMGGGRSGRLLPVFDASLLYEHEVHGGFNMAFKGAYKEYFGNSFVPMISPDGAAVRSVPTVQGGISLRFSKDETVTRGHFIKTYMHSRYPIFTLNLDGGVSTLNRDGRFMGPGHFVDECHPYLRPELVMDWKATIAPIGKTTLNVKAGAVLGHVPYTQLNMFAGNGTYLLDKTSFSTMEFFEFASDSWVSLMWDHNFYGFFLGKIPYVKKLRLREAFVFKAAWGHLSDRNNGVRTGEAAIDAGREALLLFPDSMHSMGKVPYIETGFAITNIFNLLRVDFLWRVTHRNDPRPRPRNFVVNVGLELKF